MAVPAIWLPDPRVRGERERARWRLHLVRHHTALKNRIHQDAIAVTYIVHDRIGATSELSGRTNPDR